MPTRTTSRPKRAKAIVTAKKTASAADARQPSNATVGAPQMPAMYGGKKRDKFLPWSHAEERLVRSKNYWICTSRPDGRPHSAPVWGFWHAGALYFGTHRDTRKARNLAQNRRLSVHLESGDDVVILEGDAEPVDQKALAKQLDSVSREKYGMPMMVTPDTIAYCVRPRVVLAWTEQDYPNNATRWEFRP